ncbi:MAG TPA: GNAT family N-acetyltransferase [Gaiellales bacterium]|jgi:RimJ/RimL family protein N-acetyltransferase|nr:GNAT family N-acetyltransferase [Gaiellales bacterium]
MLSHGSKAFRIETTRLVIRCWDPADAELAKDAIDTSLDHLRPWMPWAESEPTTLEQKRQLLARFAEDFARGDDAVYGIFEPDERRVVGGTGLHPRLDGNAREIGYWIRADAVGRGLAGESTAALTRVAFEVDGVERMEIHVDPDNVRSAAIPRRLGYELADGLDGNGHLVFRMPPGVYRRSPAARAALTAYDDAGARVL